MKKNRIPSIIIVLIIIAIGFNIDSSRKPKFKVIRGSYETQAISEPINTKININTASADELDTLVGIGPALAKRIIAYRESKPFSKIEEIINVKGIGTKKFDAIKDFISVN